MVAGTQEELEGRERSESLKEKQEEQRIEVRIMPDGKFDVKVMGFWSGTLLRAAKRAISHGYKVRRHELTRKRR
ncbi:hypothetical protein LCGC14_0619950 [marine sediment metagenome]|uniref:Uncharacterized protein n=1 Tax=marine sediment metagenome TaxID=412755 RepID=A0A0F9UDK4_9ZZZZ